LIPKDFGYTFCPYTSIIMNISYTPPQKFIRLMNSSLRVNDVMLLYHSPTVSLPYHMSFDARPLVPLARTGASLFDLVVTNLLASAAIAARSTTFEPQVIPTNARFCERVNAQKPTTLYRYLTSLCSVTVDSHRALHEYDIVKMILLYLKDEPKALAKAMRTCPLFIKAGVGILWEDAKPSDLLCIQDTRRRLEFAPFLKIVTLWSDEQVRDTETMI
ncbi:hypothetical protein KCU64_g93, partial [Aureobasidium melanogenum]